jgi:hypothetical protein
MNNSKDLNMNELRGMPKDIDLLISVSKSLIEGNKNGIDLTSRYKTLESLVKKVDVQYQELLKSEIKK